MGETDRIPVAVVRGVTYQTSPSAASALIRPANKDLFR